MKKIRIAQIGTSGHSHGTDVFSTLKKLPELFDIAGYVLPEGEREKFPDRMSVFDGYSELTLDQVLNDPEIEAVTVETEEIYLTRYALAAAKKKKHIHMEKPGGLCEDEFCQVVGTARENGTVFHMGYMYRYNPEVVRLRERIGAGELGEIISVEAQMNCIHHVEVRQWLSAFPGGMMFFLGCHLVDLILQLQGKPERVIALNKSTGLDGCTAEDFGMAVLEYPRGISFAKASAVEMGGFERRQLVVAGTKETVELKPLEMYLDLDKGYDLYTGKVERKSIDWITVTPCINTEPFDRYIDMMSAFAAMVRGEKENPFSYDYELEVYRTLRACCGGAGFDGE